MSDPREINNNIYHAVFGNLRLKIRRPTRRNAYPVHIFQLFSQIRNAETRRVAMCPSMNSAGSTMQSDIESTQNGPRTVNEQDNFITILEDDLDLPQTSTSQNTNRSVIPVVEISDSDSEELPPVNEQVDNESTLISEDADDESTPMSDVIDDESTPMSADADVETSIDTSGADEEDASVMTANRAELQAMNAIQTYQLLFNSGDADAIAAQHDKENILHKSTLDDISPVYDYHPGLAEASQPKRLKRKEEAARMKFLRSCCPVVETTSDDTNLNCAVCMNAFKENQSVRNLVCLHKFHKKCIERWAVSSIRCPICRRNFNGVTSSFIPKEPPSDFVRSIEFILNYILQYRARNNSEAVDSDDSASTSSD